MSDPKKLVSPCSCPSGMTEARARQETIDAVKRVIERIEPEPLQFALQVRLDSPPASSEPPADQQPVPSPDAAAAFVEASVAVDRRAFTSTAEIMAAARVWCAENDLPAFHPRALAEQLRRRRGVQAHSNGQRRGWRGVKLR